MDNNVKKVLKAVPVFAAGIVIGAVATNREKVMNALYYGLDTAMDWVEDLMIKSGLYEEELDTLENLASEDEEFDYGFDFDGPEEILPDEDEMEDETGASPMEKGDWSPT